MKKSFTSLLLYFFLAINILAQESQVSSEKTTSEGKLEDVVITGKDILKISAEKPELKLELNPVEVIYPSLETDESLLTMKIPDLNISEMVTPYGLNSKGPVKPYLNSIVRDTQMKFRLNLKNKEYIRKWSFVIVDYRGRVFRKFSGTNSPPEYFKWNYRNEVGDIIKVGIAYSSVFTFTDIAGNEYTTVNKPFTINALLHQEKEGLYISLATKALFKTESETTEPLIPDKALLDEAGDILKENFAFVFPFTIRVFSGNEEDASSIAKIIAKELSNRLILLYEDKIKTECQRSAPEEYRIEILIPNR